MKSHKKTTATPDLKNKSKIHTHAHTVTYIQKIKVSFNQTRKLNLIKSILQKQKQSSNLMVKYSNNVKKNEYPCHH